MIYSRYKVLGLFLIIFHFVSYIQLQAQQNHTMYFIPENPQVNSLNPAFQNSCGIFIGLPVISSIHGNFGSSGFSYRSLLQKSGDSTYQIYPKKLHLSKVSSINSEIYVNLLYVGLWIKKNYITFSVNEKSDMAAFYHRDFFNLIVSGNTMYEGDIAKFNRSGVFFDYRREFALGIARNINPDLTLGVKGKLLFGKINVSTNKSRNDLHTQAETFNLAANINTSINISAPVTFTSDSDAIINDAEYHGTPKGILLNAKNKGIAFDFGFIKKISDNETLSGSILDLGGIYYMSDPTNTTVKGEYSYNGQTLDSVSWSDYVDQVGKEAKNELTFTHTSNKYFTFLPTRLYLNYEYKLSPKTTLNALTSAKVYRFKIMPGVSLGASHEIIKNVHFALSWSYVQNSLKNIGTGVVIGHSPVQFYAFSDNIFGFIDPLAAKNINLRFGFNLIFGCSKKDNIKNSGCEWLKKEAIREQRYQKLRKK